MHGRYAVLEPGDVHQSLSEIDLVPAQTDQFRHPQAVAVADQDQGRIAKSMATLRCGRGDDLFDFLFRQIFPAAIVGVGAAPRYFPFYDGWGSRDGTLASPLFVQGEAPDFPLLRCSTESFRPPFYLPGLSRSLPPVRALDKHLTIVSEAEKSALYGLPNFDDFQRAEYFALTAEELALAQQRDGLHGKIACILQTG